MSDRMVRKQTYIYPHQDEALKRLAGRRGATEAEIIREALSQYLNSVEDKKQRSPMFGFVDLAEGPPKRGSTEHDRDLYDA